MWTRIDAQIKTIYHGFWNYLKKNEVKRIIQSKEYGYQRLSLLWENDFDVVLVAIKAGYSHLHTILPKWQDNAEILHAFLNKDPNNLKHVPHLQDEEEIVRLLVKKNPYALKYASNRLKNMPSIVRVAATENFFTLAFAATELRDNKAFMFEMVVQHHLFAFMYVSERLQNDWEFILQTLMKVHDDGSIFFRIPEEFRMNLDFVLIAVLINHHARDWIMGRWAHRALEITPGLSEIIRNKFIAAGKEGISMTTYEILLQLGDEKEKELEKQKVYIPARIYHAGAIYGTLESRRFFDKETQNLRLQSHVPYEIALKISQFSSLHTVEFVEAVNRSALESATKALKKARDNNAFRFSA
ncbi:MAG TPA: DUF4116 domain-containing protein [Gammaproteobacteria bacterium]|jgi:hypothetical protein|nr:DUF4116 domain-containing protein [Gammaproteobacteria bacterium]